MGCCRLVSVAVDDDGNCNVEQDDTRLVIFLLGCFVYHNKGGKLCTREFRGSFIQIYRIVLFLFLF